MRTDCAGAGRGPGTNGIQTRGAVRINGEPKYPWRALDAGGNVLDVLVHTRRDTAAARRSSHRLTRRTRALPRVAVTGELRSYGAAHRAAVPRVEYRQPKHPNNRTDDSHQPTRRRGRAMKGFRPAGAAQRLLSAFSGISACFRPGRHLMAAHDYRAETTVRFAMWEQTGGVADFAVTA